MKAHILSAVAAAALLLGGAAHAGPVIIDGTDSGDHGSFSAGANQGGWAYMQAALTNLAGAVSGTVSKTVSVIGTTTGSQAYNSITSAFNQSLLGSGWSIQYISGAAAISTFMSTLSTNTTGLLYLSTANNVSGDMDSTQLAAVNANAAAINNFVGGAGNAALGGALFSQGQTGTGAYGWLTTLIPTITATDVGGGGIGTTISLTGPGMSAFPGLSAANLANADPWHGYFSGNLGGLSILGTALDGNFTRSVIIGGGAGTVFQCGQTGQPPCPTVPEPGSMLLVATAGLALLGLRRRRQTK